jgi:large subunit ribosomal protein L2
MLRYSANTPTLRHTILTKDLNLWKGKSFRKLTYGTHTSSGRNNTGHITSYQKGGGVKQKFRVLSFFPQTKTIALVYRIEYDPNRSSHIALLCCHNGNMLYIASPIGLLVGDTIRLGDSTHMQPGNILQLKEIPVGALIHNLELSPGKGSQIIRAAGTYGQIVARDNKLGFSIRLPSGERRIFNTNCSVSLGVISNADHFERNEGKAGRMRWLNKRPHVRGIAMNPIDHPHGGGQGRTGTGRHPVTPWGYLTKGKRTRSVIKKNKFILKYRYQK